MNSSGTKVKTPKNIGRIPIINTFAKNFDTSPIMVLEDILNAQKSKDKRPDSGLDYVISLGPVYKSYKDLKLPKQSTQLAISKAEELRSSFKVKIEILETDAEYYSAQTIQRTFTDNVFFISKENPDKTFEISSYTLQRELEKKRYFLQLGNEKRIFQAKENSEAIKIVIDQVKENLTKENGKEPSLGVLAKALTDQNIPSPSGKGIWHSTTVKRIYEQ